MSEKFQASVKRVEAAIKRTADANNELERARCEQSKIVKDYFVACGGVPKREYVELPQAGDTLIVKSTVDELFIRAGAGCNITFLNKVGTVHVESGDGSLVVFQEAVGGANIDQGNGSDVVLHEAPNSLDINQGVGSTVAVMETDD